MTRHIIPISGKDSLATALVQKARRPDLLYEYMFLDVGMELPETYRWLEGVETSLGININRVGTSIPRLIASAGILPSHQRRFCTRLGKIESLKTFVGGDECIQYVGIRADEDRLFTRSESDNIRNVYPLVEVGMDLPGVYALLESKSLLPPTFFWQRLYDKVYPTVSSVTRQYIDSLKPWHVAHLFSWRSRSNCYICFYQRLYEWVGLLEHHPNLFQEAERLEKEYGEANELREKDFTWRSDGPLAYVRNRAESIFNRRVKQVREAVINQRKSADDGEIDSLGLISCGIYCGK